jgi:hypothetical protein
MSHFKRQLRSFLCVAWLSGGCGAHTVCAEPSSRGAPKLETHLLQPGRIDPLDVEAAERREPPRRAEWGVSVAGRIGVVEASGVPLVEDIGQAHVVRIPFGASMPIDCLISKDHAPAAQTIYPIMSRLAGSVRVRSLRTTSISVVNEHVAVFLDMSFDYARPGEPVGPGEVKAMFYDHPETPVFCANSDVGYWATFERITKNFAASLKLDEPDHPPPRMVEVYLKTLDGKPVGFSRREVVSGDNGTLVSSLRTASFVPISERELEMRDELETETWEADGRLIRASYASGRGAAPDVDIHLDRISAHEYAIEGKRWDQHVSGRFKTKSTRGLATSRMLGDLIAGDLLSGKVREAKVEEYRPMVDPSGPIDVVYNAESKDERRLRISVGTTQVTATADEHGLLEKLVTVVGTSRWTQERVFLRGDPK